MGVENAGDKSFYGSLNDGNLSNDFSGGCEEKMDTHEDEDSHHDEGAANLDVMVGLLEENDEIKQLKDRVIQLRNEFISDIGLNKWIHNTLMAFASFLLSIRTLLRNQNQ